MSLHNPHDQFFKEAFSRKEPAIECFSHYLPPAIVESIDWDTLNQESNSFVEKALRETSSDILYSVRLKSITTTPQHFYLYCLFEHQSSKDDRMPYRLLTYMVRIWEQLLKTNKELKKMPPILPIVLHQNKNKWKVSTQFSDLLAIPEDLKSHLSPFLPDFKHVLIDLPTERIEQLKDKLWLRVIFELFQAIAKNEIDTVLEKVIPLIDILHKNSDDLAFVHSCLSYLYNADTTSDKQTFKQIIYTLQHTTTKENIMTLAQQFREEGREEGLEKGLEKGTLTTKQRDIIEALEVRFNSVPQGLQEAVSVIHDLPRLSKLHRSAIICPDIETFTKYL